MPDKPNELAEAALCFAAAAGLGAVSLGAMFAAGELLIRCKQTYERLYGGKKEKK